MIRDFSIYDISEIFLVVGFFISCIRVCLRNRRELLSIIFMKTKSMNWISRLKNIFKKEIINKIFCLFDIWFILFLSRHSAYLILKNELTIFYKVFLFFRN